MLKAHKTDIQYRKNLNNVYSWFFINIVGDKADLYDLTNPDWAPSLMMTEGRETADNFGMKVE